MNWEIINIHSNPLTPFLDLSYEKKKLWNLKIKQKLFSTGCFSSQA